MKRKSPIVLIFSIISLSLLFGCKGKPEKEVEKKETLREEVRKETEIPSPPLLDEVRIKGSFRIEPVDGNILPKEVQDVVFDLEPGEISEIIKTPIGFYIVKLIEREDFDEIIVSTVVKNTYEEAENARQRLKKEESLGLIDIGGIGSMGVRLAELPKECQEIALKLRPGEYSEPIKTPLGYFVLKVQERIAFGKVETRLIHTGSEEEGKDILNRLKDDKVKFEDLAGEIVEEEDLPPECLQATQSLKEGEYSDLVKTRFGYYIVKLIKRHRQKYRPFEMVKEEAKQGLKTDAISDNEALWYYNEHLNDYRKPGLEFRIRIIVCNNREEAGDILDKLQKELSFAKDISEKIAIFKKYSPELNEINSELLPKEAQDIIVTMTRGELIPVLETRLGYFIVMLIDKISEPYRDFEEAKEEIKLLLVQKGMDVKTQRRVKEKSNNILTWAIFDEYISKVDSVPDEEAKTYYQNNKERFPEVEGLPEFLRLEFLKRNILDDRYREMIRQLNDEADIVIDRGLLAVK